MTRTNPKYLNKYPIYIVSKGRYDVSFTAKALNYLDIPFFVAVESHEYDLYVEHLKDLKHATILKMPFSNHGMGSGVARNWVWDHSMQNGHKRHWVLDDNITHFYRFHNNQRIRIDTGGFFRCCEDFVDRFENVPLAGLQYKFFCVDDFWYKPYTLNTRLMSCILIENSCPHRWRGKYNEDVDLSIRVLRDGYCTILFYQFLQNKMETGKLKGGNTTELYGLGTFEKSQMLVNLHPDIVTMVQKYGRWHHHADLSGFKKNKLIYRKDVVLPNSPQEYGMVAVEKLNGEFQVVENFSKRLSNKQKEETT